MKYLAFDIEAANGYKPSSICSIGVVIADEQFNILSRTNYWINPKTKYNLNGTRKNVGIDLHLDKELLENSLDFKEMYSTFHALFTDPQYIVVGHAVDADVRMLNAACERYGLPSIDFTFICSQLLYKLYFDEKEVKGLNKIALEMGVEFEQHNSEEDALVSLLTLKYLVQKSGLSLADLLAKYHYRVGSNNNFELIRPASLDGQVSKRQQTQILVEKIKKYAQTVAKQTNLYKGKTFCLARSLELSDSPLLYQVVEHIVSNGGKYTAKLAKCNVYVLDNQQTEQNVMREKRVAELQQQNLLSTTTVQQLLEGEPL